MPKRDFISSLDRTSSMLHYAKGNAAAVAVVVFLFQLIQVTTRPLSSRC